MNISELKNQIEKAYEQRDLMKDSVYQQAVQKVLNLLNDGQVRVAEKNSAGQWQTNEWIKKAILLFFPMSEMREMVAGEFHYFDKIPVRSDHAQRGVRVVPPALIRYGAFVEKGAILMPSYVNIGAYVGTGTMVDTWATVGSCAQVGKHVHLSGGVGIGGVLEPPQASPVIIEDHVFVGSRAILVEGIHVGEGAVIGANVSITASTPIIDVSGAQEVIYKGHVPPRSVVIPGTRLKKFPASDSGYAVNCALIIGTRKASTDEKTSLNNALRDFEVPV